MGAVTDYIQTTEALLDFVAARLRTQASWNVAKHPGGSLREISAMLPELGLPAAIAVYGSSSYADKPRRQASLSVVLAAEFQGEEGRLDARQMLDKAISLLDGQLSGAALFRAVSDRSLDLGTNIAAYELQLRVEDH